MATLDVVPARQLDLGAASWFRAEANVPPDNQANLKAGWAHIGGQIVVDRFTAGDQLTGTFAPVAVGFERWDLITLDSTGAPAITQGTPIAAPAPLYNGAPGYTFGPAPPDQFPIAYVFVDETVTAVISSGDITPVIGLIELRRALEGHRIDKGATGAPPVGVSTVVTALFAGETAGTGVARGVATTAPLNLVRLLDQNFRLIKFAATEAEIFGRLTHAAGVWTLTYRYIDAAGVEQTVGNIATDTTAAVTNVRLVSVPKVFSKDEATRPIFDNTSSPPASAAASASLVPFGGDGTLGSITFFVSAPIAGIFNFTSVTIDPGVVLTLTQYRALHLKCRANFTNNGTISAVGSGFNSGTGGAKAIGGVVGNPGSAPAASELFGFSPGGGGGAGTANAGALFNGGNGGAGGPGFYDGRVGGTAGGANSGAGGAAAASPAAHAWLYDLDPPVGSFGRAVAPGSGGGGGGGGGGNAPVNPTSAGGDGGDGGGIVVIEVLGNVTEGVINCNGAAGVAGFPGWDAFGFNVGAGGGGGGGGGGRYSLLYGGTLAAGTVTVAGGAAGAAGTDGGYPGTGPAGIGAAGAAGAMVRVKVAP
jgi:hypothetical protein